jgi:hypothetical protein
MSLATLKRVLDKSTANNEQGKFFLLDLLVVLKDNRVYFADVAMKNMFMSLTRKLPPQLKGQHASPAQCYC